MYSFRAAIWYLNAHLKVRCYETAHPQYVDERIYDSSIVSANLSNDYYSRGLGWWAGQRMYNYSYMMKKPLVVIANSIVNTVVKRRLAKVGYNVEFPQIPAGWLQNMVQVDMTYTWRKYGLRGIQGVNFFTMGGVENGKSTRFDKNSKYYQSWAGCYLFKLEDSAVWDISKLYSLALADQESWLRIYGVHTPKSQVIESSIVDLPNTNIDGYLTNWQTGFIQSYSDVGCRQRHTLNSLKLNIFDYMLRNKNPIETVQDCAIPEYYEELQGKSFEKVTLSGIIALTHISPSVKVLFYGNGIIQEDKDTFTDIKQEILQIITSTKIHQI